MKEKGFWKQENGEYLPHPNCKCHWEEKGIQEREKENEQRDTLIAAFKNHTKSNKLAEQLADEIINVLKENHHAQYQTQSLKNVFLVFDGKYLMSSDGKLLLPAVAGKPVSVDEDIIRTTIPGVYEKDNQDQTF